MLIWNWAIVIYVSIYINNLLAVAFASPILRSHISLLFFLHSMLQWSYLLRICTFQKDNIVH